MDSKRKRGDEGKGGKRERERKEKKS